MIDINFVFNHSVERPFNLFTPGNLKGCIINFRALGSLFPNMVDRKFINEPTGARAKNRLYASLRSSSVSFTSSANRTPNNQL